jgi:hypothetical protein
VDDSCPVTVAGPRRILTGLPIHHRPLWQRAYTLARLDGQ